MNQLLKLRERDPYEVGVVAAWIAVEHPEVIDLARAASCDVPEFERGLADGREGIGIIRYDDHVEFRQTGRKP